MKATGLCINSSQHVPHCESTTALFLVGPFIAEDAPSPSTFSSDRPTARPGDDIISVYHCSVALWKQILCQQHLSMSGDARWRTDGPLQWTETDTGLSECVCYLLALVWGHTHVCVLWGPGFVYALRGLYPSETTNHNLTVHFEVNFWCSC